MLQRGPEAPFCGSSLSGLRESRASAISTGPSATLKLPTSERVALALLDDVVAGGEREAALVVARLRHLGHRRRDPSSTT